MSSSDRFGPLHRSSKMRANVQDRSFDTDQLSRWRVAIDKLVCYSDLSTFSTQRFAGKLRQTTFGSVQVLEIASETNMRFAHGVTSAPTQMRTSRLSLSGPESCASIRVAARYGLAQGHFTIYNLTPPYTYSHPQWADVIVIKFPVSHLISRIGKVGYFLGRPYSLGAASVGWPSSLRRACAGNPPGFRGRCHWLWLPGNRANRNCASNRGRTSPSWELRS